MEVSKYKFMEFVKNHGESEEELERLLESDNYQDFALACNYLEQSSYEKSTLDYEKIRIFRDFANAKVRERIGKKVAETFDFIVKKSKQELWGGDELYKLYAYTSKPYYVKSCMKSALSLIAMMKKGIADLKDCETVSTLLTNPLYWNFYDSKNGCGHNNDNEEDAWEKIAEILFTGDYAGAFNYMQDQHYSENGSMYGAIELRKFPD